jgi:predicted O-methyltransferase YrrM
VDKGILFSLGLKNCPDLHLIGVDVFPNLDRRAKVEAVASGAVFRSLLVVDTTHEASKQVEDHSLDFVFIDADHSYEAVKDDIACWAPKVRAGGWVGGHDYHPRKFPGVVKAVDEAYGKRVQHWPGTIWGVWT